MGFYVQAEDGDGDEVMELPSSGSGWVCWLVGLSWRILVRVKGVVV